MTTAVVVATAPADNGAAAALLRAGEATLLERLLAQLRAQGVTSVQVAARPEHAGTMAALAGSGMDASVVAVESPAEVLDLIAAAAAAGTGALVLALGDVIVSDDALTGLLHDPRVRSGTVQAVDARADEFLGLGKFAGDHRPAVAVTARTLAHSAPDTAIEDALALLLTAAAGAVTLDRSDLGEWFWDRPRSQPAADAAAAKLQALDVEAVRLRSAVKAQDGFFTTFFVSPYSRYIARWAARRGLTPNQVTTVSMLIGIAAAAAFATGSRPGLVAGAVLLQLAFTADCVDGQLARYTRQFSSLGAWLDSVFDRGKEYAVFAGLAVGGIRMGDNGTIWLLAALALALQTVRHTIDFSYGEAKTDAAPGPAGGSSTTAPPPRPAPRRGALALLGTAGVRASRALEGRGWTKWAKRIFVLPIGERFALISLTAALGGPRTTFVALLIWGGTAVAYSVTGRVLRSVA